MKPLKPIFDSFWRAVAYCFRPDVLIFLLVPWVVVTAVTLGWCYFNWFGAVQTMERWVLSSASIGIVLRWFANSDIHLYTILPKLVLILVMVPVVMLCSLVFMGHMATPLLVDLVRARRFVKLEPKRNTTQLQHAGWSFWHAFQLLLALMLAAPVSILIPPAGFLILPVLGGWFTTRVLGFSVLVHYATKAERDIIMSEHDIPFTSIGVVTGYLSLVPTLMGISMAWLFADFMIWVPAAIGSYILIVGFSTLWYAHYSFVFLQEMRAKQKAKQDAELEQKAKEKVAVDALNAAEAARKTALENAKCELSKPAPPKPKMPWWQKFFGIKPKPPKPDPKKIEADEIAKKAKTKVAVDAFNANEAAHKAALQEAMASIPKSAPPLTFWQKIGAKFPKLGRKK